MSRIAQYFDLSIPAPARLWLMRQDFKHHATDFPHCPDHVKPKSWRDIRATTHGAHESYCGKLAQGFSGTGAAREAVWVTMAGPQFRDERKTETGYYADMHRESVVYGIAARLSHDRWIAGYHWNENDERCYFGQVFDDMDNALLMAEAHAKTFADMCCDDSQMQIDAQKCQDKHDDAMRRLKECIVLRNTACMQYVRGEIAQICETIRDARHEMRTTYANHI